MADPASDTIMTTDKMKPLLALSKREPVQAAIALTAGGEGLILLDKKAKPKKVAAMLKAEASKAKLQLNTSTIRYGRALVDTDYDSGMVRFFINKEAPGSMRVKLVEVVKRVPYQKVELNVDLSIEDEPEDEQPPQPEAASAAPAPQDAVPPAPPPIPEAPPPPPDMSGVRAELATLIPQITAAAGNDAGKADQMKKAAMAATLAIRSNDPDGAAVAIAGLKSLLGSAQNGQSAPSSAAPQPAAPKPAVAQGKFVTMQKSRLIWESARKRVGGELQGLKTAVAAAAKGDAAEAAVLGALGQLDEVLARLDERLLDALDAMLNEGDPNAHARLTQQAKGILGEYVAYTQSSPMLQKLDGDTPFGVKLSVASTMAATLKALQSTIV